MSGGGTVSWVGRRHGWAAAFRDVLAGALWAAVVAGALVVLAVYGLLPDGPEEWTLDWRTAHFSKQAEVQRPDISVVLVTEESLTRYPSRSPVDRGLLAELVRAIDAAEPRVIALDFIFDRPTDPTKDHALADAIRRARAPVILGAVDERARGFGKRSSDFQQAFFAKAGNRPVGHLFFAGQSSRFKVSEQVIRAMAVPFPGSPFPRSFGELVAEYDGAKKSPATQLIAWLLSPNGGRDDLFATLPVREHEPWEANLPERLISDDEAALLRGKIVLVGGQFVDRDQHLTSLWVADRERVPGVVIHAQIVAQLRDGRSVYTTPVEAEFVMLVLVGILGFHLGQRWGLNRFRAAANVAGIGALVMVSIGLFWMAGVIVPSTTLLFAWLAGVTGGHHYESLLCRLRG